MTTVLSPSEGRSVQALKRSLQQFLATTQELPTSRELVEAYQTSVAVYRAANKQASAVAEVPLKVLRGEDDVPDDHPLARLFSSHLAYLDLVKRIDITLSFWGTCLVEKQRNLSNKLEGLRWVNPNLYGLDVTFTDGLRAFHVQSPYGARLYDLAPEDAVYLQLIDLNDDFGGVAPAEVAYNFAAVHPELALTMLSIFRNRAIPALLVQPALDEKHDDAGTWTKAARDLMGFLRGAVQGAYNAGRTIVDPRRWEVHQLNQSFEHLKMLDIDEHINRAVAEAWDIPLSLMISGTANRSGQEEDRKGWWQDTLRPRVKWYAMYFTEGVAAEWGEEYRVEPDFSEVAALREDETTRTTVVTAQLNSTAISLYRAQLKLGEEPEEDFKDVYLLNGQPVLASIIREMAERKAAPEEQDATEVTDDDEPDAADGSDPAEGLVARDGDTEADGSAEAESPADAPPQQGKARPVPAPANAFIPAKAWREWDNWQRLLEQGKGDGFTLAHIPGDVGAYTRLLLATGETPASAIEAAKAFQRRQHGADGAGKDYTETARLYRQTLYDLITQAFAVDPQDGLPTLSRQQFGDIGRAEITAAFGAVFRDGLAEGGVLLGDDPLDPQDVDWLRDAIRAERRYWTALANDLYQNALPLYREYRALEVTAQHAPSIEERERLLAEAQETLAAFRVARDAFLSRVALWENKGLKRVFAQGKLRANANQNQQWRRHLVRVTKRSCRTCLAADGQIHQANAWLRYDLQPQGDNLICGGW
ncbi:MAG: phage portal protein, partial [Anaerolineae bacterium]|nr:phage portal protein [Anaerolineae bacterium]